MFIKFNRDFTAVCSRGINKKNVNRVFVEGEELQIDRVRYNSVTVDVFFSNGEILEGLNSKYVLEVYNDSRESDFILSEKVSRPSRKSASTNSLPEQKEIAKEE